MEELIHKLGINPKLLLAQIINFGILLLLLYRFLYRPILTMLQKRENYIKKSLEEAKDIEKQGKEFNEWKAGELKKVKEETNSILEKAILDGEKIRNETVIKAKTSADEMIDKARRDIESQKEQMLIEAKKELGELIVSATQKVVGKVIDNDREKRLIDETIGSLSKKEKDAIYTKV